MIYGKKIEDLIGSTTTFSVHFVLFPIYIMKGLFNTGEDNKKYTCWHLVNGGCDHLIEDLLLRRGHVYGK